jgi:hypothetical protein
MEKICTEVKCVAAARRGAPSIILRSLVTNPPAPGPSFGSSEPVVPCSVLKARDITTDGCINRIALTAYVKTRSFTHS